MLNLGYVHTNFVLPAYIFCELVVCMEQMDIGQANNTCKVPKPPKVSQNKILKICCLTLILHTLGYLVGIITYHLQSSIH